MAINSRDPWQKLLTTRTTVPSTKVLQASEVIQGFAGSWAGSWSLSPGLVDGNTSPNSRVPGTARTKLSHLGQPGFPEINFAPYAHNTNRIGDRGGSLIGHPISFDVVGPTGKNPATGWEWRVRTSGNNDRLTLLNAGVATIPQLYGFSSLSEFPGGLYVVITQTSFPGVLAGVLDGGLGDGAPASSPGGYGHLEPLGTGKYEIFRVTALQDGDTTLQLDSGKRLSSHFSFAVTANWYVRSIMLIQPQATRLVAIPGPGQTKGAETHFAVVPPERALNQDDAFPYAAWGPMAGPWSEELLDDLPIAAGDAFEYGHPPALPIPKPRGSFTALLPSIAPVVVGANRMSLQDVAAEVDRLEDLIGKIVHIYQIETADGAELFEGSTSGFKADLDSLLGWFEVVVASETFGNIQLRRMNEVDPESGRFFLLSSGWFTSETVENGIRLIGTLHDPVSTLWRSQNSTSTLTVESYSDLIPGDQIAIDGANLEAVASGAVLGQFNIGASNTGTATNLAAAINLMYTHLRAASDGAVVTVRGQHTTLTANLDTPGSITVVDPVLDYQSFNMDAVESARLTNLIDPSWVQRSYKDQPSGRLDSPSRSDRAVFNTESSNEGASGSNANPGNLLDLGFRMVLFPAKTATVALPFGQSATRCVPDWDHPIRSNEVVLDPTKPREKQYIEVDYSNGMVTLSHPVTEGSPLYPVDPNVFTAEDNPRGEFVLFACCVPYSMELGQIGAGLRVTASRVTSDASGATIEGCLPVASDDTSAGDGDQADVWSHRVVMPLVDQRITSQHDAGGSEVIVLSGDWRFKLPLSGFVELLAGTNAKSAPMFSGEDWVASTFGYYGVSWDGTNTTLEHIYGGGEDGDTFEVDASNPAVAVLRRDVWGPNSEDGVAGVEYAHDVTYGSAKRSNALRFEGASLQANRDGSLTVKVSDPLARSQQVFTDKVFSSWVLEGLQAQGFNGTYSNGFPVPYNEGLVVMRGVTLKIPAGTLVVAEPNAEDHYIYVEHTDGTECPVIAARATLPLSHPEDILLGRVQATSSAQIEILDNSLIANNDTITINGYDLTAKTSGAIGDQFNIAGNAADTITNIVNALTASGTFNTFLEAAPSAPHVNLTGVVWGLTRSNSAAMSVSDVTWSTGVRDLRNPLNDLDRRVDIYCGQWSDNSGFWSGFKPHFLTLTEAVNYANEITKPVAGDSARKARILVVGRTDEGDGGALVTCDGLVVESMPRQKANDPSSSDFDPEICFGSPKQGAAVVGIYNGNNVVFRNLSFRSYTSPPTGLSGGRVLFAAGSTSSIVGLTIENCSVNGHINSFFAASAGELRDARIARNTAWSVYGSGISFQNEDAGTLEVHDSVFEDNRFFSAAAFPNTFGIALIDTTYRIGLTVADMSNGDTITINGVVFTAAATEALGSREFVLDPNSSAITYQSLVDCINAPAGVGAGIATFHSSSVYVDSVGAGLGAAAISFSNPGAGSVSNAGGSVAGRATNNVIRHNYLKDFPVAVQATGRDVVELNTVGDSTGTYRMWGSQQQIRGNVGKYMAVAGSMNMVAQNTIGTYFTLGTLNPVSTAPNTGGSKCIVTSNFFGDVTGGASNAVDIRLTANGPNFSNNIVLGSQQVRLEVLDIGGGAYKGASPIVCMGNFAKTFVATDSGGTPQTAFTSQANWPRVFMGNSADAMFGATPAGTDASDFTGHNVQD